MIQTLFAVEPSVQWPELLASLGGDGRPGPFDPPALNFVGALSGRLLASHAGREFPELAALAHWFRPTRLARVRHELLGASSAYRLRPRGSVFIIAPANVDVLFIYGWLLSLLSGNATVVRVSQKPSPPRDAFLQLVRSLAEDAAHKEALRSSAIISYPHDHSATATLSKWCDLRLVWGGDATVSTIRTVPLKPTAVEAAFADRFSMAAFDAARILESSDRELADLARRFANDTMWLGQQACSSPRILFWIGSETQCDAAKDRFWRQFAIASQRFDDEPAAMMSRVSDLFTMAAEGVIDGVSSPLAQLPARARAVGPEDAVRDLHSGFGLFVEYQIDSITQVVPFLSDKDQTLVVHGIAPGAVAELVEQLPNRSLDRIVGVGQATDFDITWDGTNLLDLLTRRIIAPSRQAA